MLFFPVWLYLLVLTGYTTRYTGYVCMVFAVMVDVLYGYGVFTMPLYTLMTTGVVAAMTIVRPRLTWA